MISVMLIVVVLCIGICNSCECNKFRIPLQMSHMVYLWYTLPSPRSDASPGALDF